MNALRLLIAMIATSQVGFAQSPNNHDRDYGWQVLEGELEYIIQITPEKLAAMQSRTAASPAGEELQSYMPPELVGRVRRVVVRIGNTPLPQTPSLLEIQRTFPNLNTANDLAAALGNGNLSNLDPSNMTNVQGNGLPALPFGQPSTQNPVDNAAMAQAGANALGGNALGGNTGLSAALPPNSPTNAYDKFLNGAGGQMPSTTPNLPSLPNTSTAMGGSNKYNDTSTWNRANSDAASMSGDPLALTASGIPYQQTPTDAYAYQNRTAPPLPSNSSDPSYVYSQNPVQNFGARPSGLDPNARERERGQSINGQTDVYGQLNGSAESYASRNPQQPSYPTANDIYKQGYLDGTTLLASKPIGGSSQLPGTEQGSSAQAGSGSGESSPGDLGADSLTKVPATTNDRIIEVFFLLSLVVNVYLGYLIQKLLTRYRSLLSSVRGQAA